MLVMVAVPVLAQTGVPTSYTFKIFPAGSTTPVSTSTVPAANIQCDLAPSSGSTLNPTRWRWNDLARTGRQCELQDATRLAALPDGLYNGTIAASNADGVLGESPLLPFERRRPNPPAVPTGGMIIQ